MPNYYSRASKVVRILKDSVALKILLQMYPNKKYNPESLSKNSDLSIYEICKSFEYLDKNGLIKDNPTSGNKVLTEEGTIFLEQTATVFPELKKFLEEQTEQKTLA